MTTKTAAPADLFHVLDGIVASDDAAETLADTDMVISYADACGQHIDYAQAERIQRVGRKWLTEQAEGNGEWSRMRHEARAALEVGYPSPPDSRTLST